MRNYEYKIPLGSGRFAYNQTPAFRDSGDRINNQILRRWSAPSYFYHLKKGGHVAAARAHTNSTSFSLIDIKGFFHSISKNKIIRSLKRIGFEYRAAAEIASESVVRGDKGFFLPFGFVQSPLLSSVVLDNSALGRDLRSITRPVKLSCYVDDIILSSNSENELRRMSDRIISSATASGFEVNEDKTKLLQPQIEVFNLDLSHQSLNVCEARLNQFDQELTISATDEQRYGILRYVASINIDQAEQLADRHGIV